MKNKLSIIIIVVVAALGGFGMGYLFFANDLPLHDHSAMPSSEETIWTCSMHPQIRQPESGDCPICGMDLIPAEQGGEEDLLVLEMTPTAVALANIETTIAGSASANAKTIALNGKIKVDERRSASQAASVPGRIEKLYVSFTGEQVVKGQKLATIYSPELLAAQREFQEALKLENINPDLVLAAQKKMEYWKVSTTLIEQLKAGGEAQALVDIFADASGVVMDKMVSVGDYLKEGQVLLNLMNLHKVWIVFDAYEEDLPHLRIGDKVAFETPSAPGKTFFTKISYIDPLINSTTRVAAIRGEINNAEGLLKPEMFVKGEVKGQGKKKADATIAIPKSSVLWTGKRSVVYVKVPDREIPSYEFREVVLGERKGSYYVIESGLEPGEEIVSNGAFSIDAAAQLNNQRSMMNRAVKVKKMEEILVAVPDYQASTPAVFQEQLGRLSEEYILLKDALIQDDVEKAKEGITAFLAQLEKVDKTLLEGDAFLYWEKQWKAMEGYGQLLKAAKEDVEKMRQQFLHLSNSLIESIKVFGVSSQTFYVQHCPMANNNEGADWLSRSPKVLNPYFGDKMLTCGMVVDTLE